MLPSPWLTPPMLAARGHDHEGVRAKAGDRALDGDGRAVADLHHRDHGCDADDDAQHGEHRAHDVAPERA